MNILSRYILMMFARHMLMMLCGLSGIFMVFDVLSNAGDITQNAENPLKTLFHYVGLRLPGIFVLVMPMAALLATMLTLHKMVKGREMVAIGGAGFTIYKVAKTLVIGGVLLATLQFSASEYIVSDSSARLRLWADNDYTGPPPATPKNNKTFWAASADYIVHYETASPDGQILRSPFVVHRTKDGLIDEYIRATRAFYEGPEWRLENTYGKTPQKLGSSIVIDLGLHPDDFSLPAQTLEEMHLSTLWGLMFTDDPQQALYTLWFQRKLAQPLSIILMVIMAAPLGLFMARQYNALFVSFGFIMASFVFLVSERLLLSLGESAALPSFLAVWSPLLIFGTMSLWFMLYKQE